MQSLELLRSKISPTKTLPSTLVTPMGRVQGFVKQSPGTCFCTMLLLGLSIRTRIRMVIVRAM